MAEVQVGIGLLRGSGRRVMRYAAKLHGIKPFIHPNRQVEGKLLPRLVYFNPGVFRIKRRFRPFIHIKREVNLLAVDVFQIIPVSIP
ncbi:hypothetical protein D3C74_286610 [compost metagenome]